MTMLSLEWEQSARPGGLTAPGTTPQHLRVLVVEDNRDAADSLRLLLELYGFEVAVAFTGPEGLRAAARLRPDVLLCDIGLPGLDGYAVARALRGDPATARMRMIAITAYSGDEDQRRSREAGFDQHLTKPVDPAVLKYLLVHERAAPVEGSGP